MKNFVVVDTPIEIPRLARTEWRQIAVPAPIAHRLLAAGLLSLDTVPGPFAPFVAVCGDWGGEWWTVREVIQIPGAFILRR